MPSSRETPKPPKMNRALWEDVSGDYGNKVLSVFDNDLEGLVTSRIKTAGKRNPDATAADLGCGVGQFTPSLAQAFKSVVACDISKGGVKATHKICSEHENVESLRLDLTRDPMPFDPVDFALCVNVLIMPSLDKRLRAWRCVTNQVAAGGTLLLVVPSLESIQMNLIHRVDGLIDQGLSCKKALKKGQSSKAKASDLQQGVHRLEGLPTKHYFATELEYLLSEHEFDLQEMVKIEYSNNTHADTWDWLVLAKRR